MIKNSDKIYKTTTPKILITESKVYYGTGLYQPETLAIFNRSRQEGFNTPDIFFMRKIDGIIYNLKIHGIWDKIDCLFWFAYGVSSFASFRRINWKNPNGPLGSIGGGLVIEPNGIKGNGVNGYFDTGFNPSLNGVNYTLNNAWRGAYIYTSDNTTQNIDSALYNNTLNDSWQHLTSSGQLINSTNPLSNGRGNNVICFKMILRNNATSVSFFYSTVSSLDQAQNATNLSNQSLRLLNAGSIYSTTGIGMYVAGGGAITLNQYSLFRAIINNGLNAFNLNQTA